jgi:hypothetical protein
MANRAAMDDEKSLVKELLEALQIPETEHKRMAEEYAADLERDNASPGTYTIKACAVDTTVTSRSLEPGALLL